MRVVDDDPESATKTFEIHHSVSTSRAEVGMPMRSEESGESGESDYDAAKMQVEVLLEYVEISTRVDFLKQVTVMTAPCVLC
jgi:hypothetical protein